MILSDRDRQKLLSIDESLERLKQGSYGICEECELDIAEERLKALPFTRLCVSCQADQEKEAKQVRRSEEDRDKDGRMDTWTVFQVVEGKEAIARIERDQKGRGKPDLFETYHTVAGKSELEKREEDVNGDGSVDVISVYEGGKLVRREVTDPALLPL